MASFIEKIIAWLSIKLNWNKDQLMNEEVPTTTPEAPNQPIATISMLDTFCTAIRDFEGKPGDLNYQLNNPGDCRPSPVGYLTKYQPVIIIDTDTNPEYPYRVGKFAKFPTYELGWEYLENLVHFTATNHPKWTILDFFQNYAPSSDRNNPNEYAVFVSQRCKLSPDTTLQVLFG